MKLVNTPSIPLGIVVHTPSTCVDAFPAEFALTISGRGFRVARVDGVVQLNNRRTVEPRQGCAERIETPDLASGEPMGVAREPYGTIDGHVAGGCGAGSSLCRLAMPTPFQPPARRRCR